MKTIDYTYACVCLVLEQKLDHCISVVYVLTFDAQVFNICMVVSLYGMQLGFVVIIPPQLRMVLAFWILKIFDVP